jgi:hypothetical protein
MLITHEETLSVGQLHASVIVGYQMIQDEPTGQRGRMLLVWLFADLHG